MTADQIIAHLNLSPHPEGGWYRQTWIADARPGERAAGTAIYFLLKSGQASHWHRVDAAEIWHYHIGAPLKLGISANDQGPKETVILGSDLLSGEVPQEIVPKNYWQAAETTGDFTLVSCTVSPAFQFETFELAPKNFYIP
ncbi:cupin domain-containing protein [Parasulfitobacter algicola]|uniref:Cupin domain-containing protein n=1 Tax=Parasulfitobacter algicola TaxID=2614809 RepID=A0ABX2IRJ2_9RHOB|nr:cupin domain-containing protein [Sulfitobacter algicola]NSX55140.1 cupin domain-containing protein [Sulfitobacter algicola]